MKYIAMRQIYGSKPRRETSFSNIEVKDGRVTGIMQWDNEKGSSPFDVKLQPDNRFFKGSGSGKIAYFLKEVSQTA
jgi:hypothetical protein